MTRVCWEGEGEEGALREQFIQQKWKRESCSREQTEQLVLLRRMRTRGFFATGLLQMSIIILHAHSLLLPFFPVSTNSKKVQWDTSYNGLPYLYKPGSLPVFSFWLKQCLFFIDAWMFYVISDEALLLAISWGSKVILEQANAVLPCSLGVKLVQAFTFFIILVGFCNHEMREIMPFCIFLPSWPKV